MRCCKCGSVSAGGVVLVRRRPTQVFGARRVEGGKRAERSRATPADAADVLQPLVDVQSPQRGAVRRRGARRPVGGGGLRVRRRFAGETAAAAGAAKARAAAAISAAASGALRKRRAADAAAANADAAARAARSARATQPTRAGPQGGVRFFHRARRGAADAAR